MKSVLRPIFRSIAHALALCAVLTWLLRPLPVAAISAKPLNTLGINESGISTKGPSARTTASSAANNHGHVASRYERFPISFELNRGQLDNDVKFLARGQRQDLFLTAKSAILAPKGDATPAALHYIGANPNTQVIGLDQLPGKANYFIGSDPSGWRTNVPTYARVSYKNLYPGIDLVYYGRQDKVEFDYVVQSGASPVAIKFGYDGPVRIDTGGALVLSVKNQSGNTDGDIRLERPFVYQDLASGRRTVSGRYLILNGTSKESQTLIGFEVGSYDHSRPLVIDPVLAYSGFLGGGAGDHGNGIAVSASGAVYVTGSIQRTQNGFEDAFVAKIGPDGTQLVYISFLGGSGGDFGNGIAVDASGSAYLAGTTSSSDFPVTAGAFQRRIADGQDAFVAKLSSDGSTLSYSTYLGGASTNIFGDTGNAIAIDADGDAFVTGTANSTNFPTTANAFQRTQGSSADAFLTELNPTGSALIYSTYLGGRSTDQGFGVAIDGLGNAFVTGLTLSGDFPTRNAFQPVYGGTSEDGTSGVAGDAFITKIDTVGGGLVYSSYLGGSRLDQAFAIALDPTGAAYVTGRTFSGDFPTTAGSLAPTPTPNIPVIAFVSKVDAAGHLAYSTYLGGRNGAEGHGIAVDSNGEAFITGQAQFDFPLARPTQSLYGGGTSDAFVAALNPAGSLLDFSTFLGGSGTDVGAAIASDSTSVYITGVTRSQDFPATGGLGGAVATGGGVPFIAKIRTSLNLMSNSLTISDITPAVSGNTGIVTAAITGAQINPNYFKRFPYAKLARAGHADIVGSTGSLRSNSGVSTLQTSFDLRGQDAGAWDVVLTSPDGAVATLPGGFTVQEGRAPQTWVDTLGPFFARGRQPVQYDVLVGNSGNIDAIGVVLTIKFPKFVGWRLGVQLQRITEIPNVGPVDFSQAPISTQTDTETIIPLFLSNVPPGAPVVIPLLLTMPDDSQFAHLAFTVDTSVTQPLYRLTASAQPSANLAKQSGGALPLDISPCGANYETDPDKINCILALLNAVFAALGVPTGASCTNSLFLFALSSATSLTQLYCGGASTGIGEVELPVARPLIDVALNLAGNALNTIGSCLGAEAAALLAAKLAALGVPGLGQAIAIAQLAIALIDVIEGCLPLIEHKTPIEVHVSGDPNDKTGSVGVGAAQFVRGVEPLRYTIFFQNVPNASAPAQQVVVTDQLDTSNLDLSTFSFSFVTIAGNLIQSPPGLADFTAEMDMRPAQNVIAHVNSHLDPQSGLITWRFTSLDPATGQPTTDSTAGFLPPDVTAPQGEGSVFYTVAPKPGLPTGAVINNQATIVFDFNAPIDTPVFMNTIDNTPPVSHALPLANQQATSNFLVKWAGADVGSGVMDFTVMVSENGGPSSTWLQNTTATEAIFSGVPGQKYDFTVMARDQVGNVEPNKTAADATTVAGAVTINYGDLNNDGTIDASDLVLLANVLAGNVTLTNSAAADVFLDGTINAADLVTLANFLAGNISVLPVVPASASSGEVSNSQSNPAGAVGRVAATGQRATTPSRVPSNYAAPVRSLSVPTPTGVRIMLYREVSQPACRCRSTH